MQTTTVPNPKNTFKQGSQLHKSPFDEVNSLLSFTIYHERSVGHGKGTCMKYYMKKKIDKEYDNAGNEDAQLAIELRRSIRFLESKVNGRFGDNRIMSIQCYFNDNKGGTVEEEKPNPLLCKLIVMRNYTFEAVPNVEIIPTPQGQQFVSDIMMAWQKVIEKARQ